MFMNKLRLLRLLDHHVGAPKQRKRESETERLGVLHVNNQFALPLLLHWQVGGFFTLENPACVDPDDTTSLGKASAVAHQAATSYVFAPRPHGGQRVPGCKCDELFVPE